MAITDPQPHAGVGALLTNRSRTRFFVQRKDEGYPLEQYRLALSFWGGEIEPEDADRLAAVNRELEEEIPGAWEWLASKEKKEVKTIWVEPGFDFTLFEVVLEEKEMDRLPNVQIGEGMGEMVDREQALEEQWGVRVEGGDNELFEKLLIDLLGIDDAGGVNSQ